MSMLRFPHQVHSERQGPEDMSGWDLAQKGYWYFLNGSREDNLKSQQAYRAALDQAPRYAYA
jgi:hypothetical protein